MAQSSNPDSPAQRPILKVPVKKYLRLLDYMQLIGFDPAEVAKTAGVDYQKLQRQDPAHGIHAVHFSRLYQVSVAKMQELNHPLPWGAGIGSEAFEFMCYTIISCKTLGEALERAARFDYMLYPMIGYRMSLSVDGDTASLAYRISTKNKLFVPEGWDRAQHHQSIANSSGLRVWTAFCGWLVGRALEPLKVSVAGPYVSKAYEDSLHKQFGCPIVYDAKETALSINSQVLNYRIVHSPESLADFLSNTAYWLMATETSSASTSAAIKSLLGRDFRSGIPSFEEMAANLHMSGSSLRRRLLKEDTSYQQLKDQCRCEIAMALLTDVDIKIQAIGEQLGFTETSSFIRSFRAWSGITPKAFREQNKPV